MDFSGAAVYAANLPRQPAVTDAADLGTGTRRIVDAILRVGGTHAARALAWKAILLRASPVPKPRHTSASVWTGRAPAHLVVPKRQRLNACGVRLTSAGAADMGVAYRIRCDEHHGLLGHRRRQPGD